MKPDLRISIKDYRRNKSLKVTLAQVPFGQRQFWVRMNGKPWPEAGRPVSVTRVMTALRKAVAGAVSQGSEVRSARDEGRREKGELTRPHPGPPREPQGRARPPGGPPLSAHDRGARGATRPTNSG